MRPPREALLTEKGDRVRFSISDAFLPTAEELAAMVAPNQKMEGTVINFSDSGPKTHHFAVIDVVQRRRVIVPVAKLEVLHGKHSDLLD